MTMELYFRTSKDRNSRVNIIILETIRNLKTKLQFFSSLLSTQVAITEMKMLSNLLSREVTATLPTKVTSFQLDQLDAQVDSTWQRPT